MNYFKNRRNKVLEQLHIDEMAIFFAGEPVRNSADSEFEFNSNRNYYYLTGINEPSGVLVLMKQGSQISETLFIRDIDYDKEKWIGRFISVEKAREVSEIQNISFVSGFESFFEMALSRRGINRLMLDMDRQHFSTRALEAEVFAKRVNEHYPMLPIRSSHAMVSQLRSIKDEKEIEAIREAAEITNAAIGRALKQMKPGMYEYQVMAHFLFELNMNNATEMFDTIMASGENGPILHYVENNSLMKDGDLILFDLGAKKNHYGADISRTFPVNGKFTEFQKQIYDIVLTAQEEVTKAAKPGVTLIELNDVCKHSLTNGLMSIGFISNSDELSKYYYHSVSHFLGLDTHDVGQTMTYQLVEGNVITNEPGLYIAEKNLGIRIETDLLITKDGCEDLAPQILKTTEEIEAFMK